MLTIFTMVMEWFAGEHDKPGSMWNRWLGNDPDPDGEEKPCGQTVCPQCGEATSNERMPVETAWRDFGWICPNCGYEEGDDDLVECKDCGSQVAPGYAVGKCCPDCAEARA